MNPWVIPELLKETAFEWHADRAPRLGAALAFYTLFSLAPLLVVIIAIAALAFGRDIASVELVQQIEIIIGPDGARVIQATIENTSDRGLASPQRSSVWRPCCSVPRSCLVSSGMPSIRSGK